MGRRGDTGSRALSRGAAAMPSPRRHEQVAAALREMIRTELRPGDPLPSVRTLMATLQVSMPTVQAGQAILGSEGLIEARQGSGVFVAKNERQRRIGVLSDLDLLHPRTGHFFRALAGGVMERLREQGLQPTLYTGCYCSPLEPPSGPVCPQFWEDIEAGRLDGGVIVDAWLNDAYFERCRRCSVPLVGSWTGYNAATDTSGIVTAAVRRLAEQGCTLLGLMTWEHDAAVEPFRRAVSECGMATAEGWIKDDISPNLAGAGWDEFREIWAASAEKPDGLVILDDLLFADAQMAIFELGLRVPEQLRLAVQTNRGADIPLRLPAAVFEIDPAEAAGFLAATLLRRLRGELLPPITQTLGFREIAAPAAATALPGRHRRRSTPIDANRLQSTPVDSRRLASAGIGRSRKATDE